MKKIHLSLIIIASILLIGSVTAGWVHLYIGQNTLPDKIQVAGYPLGGKDSDEALKLLDARLRQMESIPLTLSVAAKGIPDAQLTLKEAGVSFEADAFKEAVAKLHEGSWLDQLKYRWHFQTDWNIVPHWDISALKEKFTPEWEQEHFGLPVEATRRISGKDEVVYTPEVSVSRIDWNTLKEQMTALIPKDFALIAGGEKPKLSLDLPLYRMVPNVTIGSLKEEGIERKIIEFSTGLGSSGPGRVYNVDSAAKAVNGMVLKPGDVFDYSKVIAKAEEKYGFQEAPVILNGKLVPGVGGGICQVSSTVYNAAVRTGLEIVERRNHSLPVSYLPKGQDATFAEGSINFRFRNNTGKSLLIQAEVKDRNLIVKFFGTFPKNVTYDLMSRTVETLPVTEKFVQNPTLPVGGQEILQSGKPGYVVETYQIKKVDGKEVSRKRISRDTYRPQSRLIAVHTEDSGEGSPTPGSEEQIVEDGVSGPNF